MDSLPPFDLLKKVTKKFPGIWGVIDSLVKSPTPNWDERCYLPIGLAIGIFPDFKLVDWERQKRRIYYALQFSALSVWRMDKEIFQFSPELEGLLFEQSSDDDIDIPSQVLVYLPYRAFYVRYSSTQECDGEKFDGFFVHYEWDTQRGGELCIRFLFLTEKLETAGTEIKLSEKTLSESFSVYRQLTEKSLKKIQEEERRKSVSDGHDVAFREILISPEMIKNALELVLYICAQNTDVTASPKQATYHPKKGKIEDRYAEVRTWDVGVRLAPKIRLAREAERKGTSGEHKSHASPRAHMRRGHWHHYWTGPKDGERNLILKWTAPMLIGGVDENSPAVIHHIENEKEDKK